MLAWGQGKARAVKEPGGWRVTGHWLFASGSRHASWLGGHCPTFEADGTPRLTPDGKPFERTMLFPREAAKIDDVWQVLGLRGTGSDSYSVTDMFIADAYSVTRDREEERQEAGVLYRFTHQQHVCLGFGAVGLGIARAMLDAFTATGGGEDRRAVAGAMRDSAVVQSLIAVSDAKLRSARAWLIQVLTEVRESVADPDA